MPIYEVSYTLDYTHRVAVAVEARTPGAASALVNQGLDQGTLWDDPAYRLIEDEYEEDDNGRALELDVKRVKNWPTPMPSARSLIRNQAAVEFVRMVARLTKHGELGPDGFPFVPPNGADDAHAALMALIDAARTVLEPLRYPTAQVIINNVEVSV
jgi:hypothetical protein